MLMGAVLATAWVSACSSDAKSSSDSVAGSGNLGGTGAAGAEAAGSSLAPSTAGSAAAGNGNSAGGTASVGSGGRDTIGGAGAPSSAGSGAAGAPASVTLCGGDAKYKVSLNVTWNDSAVQAKHYTTIIGGVHGAAASLWKLGGTATDGIKSMAEAGGTMLLSNEVLGAVNAGTAKEVIKFGGGNAPGTSTGMIDVSPQFPQVSFGSMIAPSPDWFVGVSSMSLCESGAWVATKTVDAIVYDAGTKDGADFDYGSPETQPRAPIDYATKFPDKTPAGKWKFDKQ